MNFLVLFLGIVFIGVGFAVPFLADCGLGSIGLILLGLVGVYMVISNVFACFGKRGKKLQDKVDEKIRLFWALLLGDSQFSEPVYYAIGIGKSLLIGGFFTIFSIGLGWLTFQMFYSHYIQEGVLVGLLFAVSVVPGPVTLFKGIREMIGRVKKYWNEK